MTLFQVREMRPAGELAARTLLITEIPKHECSVESLSEYFRYERKITWKCKKSIAIKKKFSNSKEEFASLTVEDIAIAHDIKQLCEIDEERECAEQARLYCENYARRREPLKMYPHRCGQITGCCCIPVSAKGK